MSNVIDLNKYRGKSNLYDPSIVRMIKAEQLANERRIEEEKKQNEMLADAYAMANDIIAKDILGLPPETL